MVEIPEQDVVVTRDGLAFVYGLCGTPYERDVHQIVETPDWLLALARSCKQPDLFLFCHYHSGRYVIGQWVVRPGEGNGTGLFQEVKSFDPEEGPGPREALLERMVPDRVQKQRIRDKVRKARYVAKMLKEDSWEERQSVSSYLKGKGMDEEAVKLKRGSTPFMGTKEAEAKGMMGMDLNVGTLG